MTGNSNQQFYDEKYFAGQLAKSAEKAAFQYGKLLHYAGISATTHPRLLDAGCGAGPALPFLQQQGFDVTGSDFIFYPLLEARKRSPTVPLINADLNLGLPFRDACFDVVLASEVIEHLAQAELFAADAYRVLKPGGVLIMTTPNLWDVRRGVAKLRGRVWSGYEDITHINLMTPRRLLKIVRAGGFERVKWRTGWKPMYSRSVRRLGWRLDVPYPPLIGNGILVAAFIAPRTP